MVLGLQVLLYFFHDVFDVFLVLFKDLVFDGSDKSFIAKLLLGIFYGFNFGFFGGYLGIYCGLTFGYGCLKAGC